MDNRLQATFMPRQAPGANDAYVRPKGPLNFLMAIALVLILIVGAAWGGLYFYKGYIVSSNETKKAKIQEEISSFDPELTKQLTVLRARLEAGKLLITNHVAFSEILDLLAANTVQTVQFNSLSYSSTDDGKISLNLKGQSYSYNAIAFQSDVFSKVPEIQAPVFSGLVLDDEGAINFNVEAGLDPTALRYSNQFKDEIVVPLTTTQTGTTSTSTSVRTGSTASTTPVSTSTPVHTGTASTTSVRTGS